MGYIEALAFTGSASFVAPSFAVVSFYRSNPDLIVSLPNALSSTLGPLMVGVPLPGKNRLLAGPIGNRDAQAICAVHALYAKKTGLRSRQLNHAIRHAPVTSITVCPQRGKDYCIVRRLRCSSDGVRQGTASSMCLNKGCRRIIGCV